MGKKGRQGWNSVVLSAQKRETKHAAGLTTKSQLDQGVWGLFTVFQQEFFMSHPFSYGFRYLLLTNANPSRRKSFQARQVSINVLGSIGTRQTKEGKHFKLFPTLVISVPKRNLFILAEDFEASPPEKRKNYVACVEPLSGSRSRGPPSADGLRRTSHTRSHTDTAAGTTPQEGKGGTLHAHVFAARGREAN